MKKKTQAVSRRKFMADSLTVSAAFSAPFIVPASIFGKPAPSYGIQVASIGCGRILSDELKRSYGGFKKNNGWVPGAKLIQNQYRLESESSC